MLGYNLTPVVKALLLLNIGIFAIANFTNFDSVESLLALRYYQSLDFHIYQIFTHIFMHASLMHLFSNMFALFMFGPALENIWGPKRFLTFYMICGIGAALCYTTVNAFEYRNTENKVDNYYQNPSPYSFELIMAKEFSDYYQYGNPQLHSFAREFEKNPSNSEYIQQSKEILSTLYRAKINTPMVGASGAIFGVLLGFGMLFPNTVLMLLFPPIPIKAKYFVAIYGLLELYAGVHHSSGDTVAHFAHIGGMIFGYLMIVYWRKKRDRFY